LQRLTDIDRIARQTFDKEILDRAAALEHLMQDPRERGEIGAVGPAMNEMRESIAIARRLKLADERRG
jgi:hypothetical protein